jgi:hypothetical protein
MTVYTISCNDRLRALYETKEKAMAAFTAIKDDVKSQHHIRVLTDKGWCFQYHAGWTGIQYTYHVAEVTVQ